MGYYAVTRSGQDDELKHFKYVFKEKKNGKWVYYYRDDMHKKDGIKEVYEKTKGKPDSKYGTYEHGSGTIRSPKYTIKVVKGKKLVGEELTTKNLHSGDSYKIRKIGKIEQGYDSAKNKIKKIGKKSVKSLNKQIDRGQKWLNGLFD